MIDLNFTKLQIVFDPRWRRCTMTWFDWGEEKLIKQSDDGEAVEQFDLPPEEWRWQKDGPADRGGSTLSAAAAQCHIQTDPSSGSRLLYLHATAGETTGARTQEPKIKKTAVRSLLFFHVEAEIWSWTDNSFLRGLVCMCEETSWTQITFNISFPTACRRRFSSPGVYFSSRALCHFNVFYVTLSALSEVWLKHLWHHD